jgi:ABC-type sulfate transport system substrate-binding protein
MFTKETLLALTLLALALSFANPIVAWAEVTLLNVSYDPTRELYEEFNAAFARHWKEKPERTSRSSNPMTVPASRRAPSSMAWKPMW